MTRQAKTPLKVDPACVVPQAPPRAPTRTTTLIGLMRAEGGASAADLAAAVGWQAHSVRGFISGTLKKRADLEVVVAKHDGVTRYRVRDRAQ